jgi:hypothetical protein
VQHGALLGGNLLAAWGMSHLIWDLGLSPTLSWVAVGLGLGLVILGGFVRQRWEVSYRGHRVQFDNGMFTGERLFIDGRCVARGGFGYRMELRGTITDGDGAGDQIMALSEAGLLQFRCRIIAELAV